MYDNYVWKGLQLNVLNKLNFCKELELLQGTYIESYEVCTRQL